MVVRVIAAIMVGATLLAGCASRPPVPKGNTGVFSITEDLAGRTVARGRFTTILGVDRGFTATLDGSMEGQTFVLREAFAFDDGEKDVKTWRLTPDGQGGWTGTREDVVGTARGYMDGRALRLEYLAEIPRKNGKSTRVRFRDVLVRGASGEVINKAIVSYRGVPIGRVELTMKRPAA